MHDDYASCKIAITNGLFSLYCAIEEKGWLTRLDDCCQSLANGPHLLLEVVSIVRVL